MSIIILNVSENLPGSLLALKLTTSKVELEILHHSFMDCYFPPPQFIVEGRKIVICVAFFSKFCQNGLISILSM